MSNLTNKQLYNLWEAISRVSGWVGIIGRNKLLPENVLLELEKLDDEVIDTSIKEKDYYYSEVLPKVKKSEREFVEEMTKENPEWVKERRLEYLKNEIDKLEKEVERIIIKYVEDFKKDKPYWLRKLSLEMDFFVKKQKELKRFLFEFRIKKYDREIKNNITDEMILKAREFPFEDLMKTNKFMGKCPFHNEKKASFYVKNNYGFCFGCGWKGDVLQFVMETKNIGFVEAVKMLTR